MSNVTLITLLNYVKAAHEQADQLSIEEERDPEYEDMLREQSAFDTTEVVDLFKYDELELYAEWLVWAHDYDSCFVKDIAKAVECEMAWQMQTA